MKRVLFAAAYAGLLFASHRWEEKRNPDPLSWNEVRHEFNVPPQGGRPGYSFTLSWREGVQMHTRRKGPAILLLHGSPGEAADFDRLMPLLAREYPVLAPDLPGFGKSVQPLSDYGNQEQARRMFAFLDAKGIREVIVLGYSLGSGVALEMAAAQPDRVRRLILYGGIGIQEGEGSGSWLVEHMKYAAGWLYVCALPEALPHFGFFGSRNARCGFIRSFLDSDQRRLRSIIENFPHPVLILQGTDDILVPVEAARDHSVLFPRADLLELPGSHFLVFSDHGSELLANHILSFLEKPAGAPLIEREKKRPLHYPVRPAWISDALALARLFIAAWLAAALAVDAGIIVLAALAAAGFLDVQSILLAYFIGFFYSRLRVFLGPEETGSPHVDRLIRTRPRESGRLFLRGILLAPIWRELTQAARGRMTMIGGIGTLWGIASLLVLLILFPASAAFSALAPPGSNTNRIIILPAALAAFGVMRLLFFLCTKEGRRRIHVFFARAGRLEFYPPFLFYLPLVPTILRLSFRYGGFTTLCASNPAFPDGGFVGESKSEILGLLPGKWTLSHFRWSGGRPDTIVQEIAERRWKYPVVVKPDAGQKGMGVTLCKSEGDLIQAASEAGWPVIVQKYHPGPHEAGIFYMRIPGEKTGWIFSITDKHLPAVEGDGRTSLEDLILSHPRYSLQADLFLSRHRHRLTFIPAAGQNFLLGNAGNHFQGALFRDGAELITPALAKTIDKIAQTIPGFYFGRFDVRYKSISDFRKGRGFQIVELNGATSESTNVYDPEMRPARVYSILRRQWELLFQIGHANIQRGAARPSVLKLIQAWFRYRRIAPHPHSR